MNYRDKFYNVLDHAAGASGPLSSAIERYVLNYNLERKPDETNAEYLSRAEEFLVDSFDGWISDHLADMTSEDLPDDVVDQLDPIWSDYRKIGYTREEYLEMSPDRDQSVIADYRALVYQKAHHTFTVFRELVQRFLEPPWVDILVQYGIVRIERGVYEWNSGHRELWELHQAHLKSTIHSLEDFLKPFRRNGKPLSAVSVRQQRVSKLTDRNRQLPSELRNALKSAGYSLT